MNENEKDLFLRKLFKIKDELSVPPHFLKAYDVFEHMLGLGANGEAVPEDLMVLYRLAKRKSDALYSGAELSHDVLIMLVVLHQVLNVQPGPLQATVRPVGSAVGKRRGRPPKIPPVEVVSA